MSTTLAPASAPNSAPNSAPTTPVLSHKRLFNWVTELSKCKTEEEIKSNLDKVKVYQASYKQLIIWSNSKYIKKTFEDIVVFQQTRLETPVSGDRPENLHYDVSPDDSASTSNDEESNDGESTSKKRSEISDAESESENVTDKKTKKQKHNRDADDYSSIRALLRNNSKHIGLSTYPINPNRNPLPAERHLLEAIRINLLKCNNSTFQSNEARYIVACNLTTLSKLYSGKMSGFYRIIKDQFDISPR
jgi:hypothetical protein